MIPQSKPNGLVAPVRIVPQHQTRFLQFESLSDASPGSNERTGGRGHRSNRRTGELRFDVMERIDLRLDAHLAARRNRHQATWEGVFFGGRYAARSASISAKTSAKLTSSTVVFG